MKDIIKTLKICYKRTGDYKGRSGRKEYWTFTIYLYAIFALTVFLAMNVSEDFVLLLIFPLLNIFTGLALSIRRLHDLNLSAWILIIPVLINGLGEMIGMIAIKLLVFVGMKILYLMPGTKGKNDYGVVHKIK